MRKIILIIFLFVSVNSFAQTCGKVGCRERNMLNAIDPADYVTLGQLHDSIVSHSGTVTNFTAGTLNPVFTTSVANSHTTPALSFILSNAAAHKYLGNNTALTASPQYVIINLSDIHAVAGAGITLNGDTIKATGGGGGLTFADTATSPTTNLATHNEITRKAANIHLSNLNTTAVNSDIIPNSDGLRGLGSGTIAWDGLFTYDVTFSPLTGSHKLDMKYPKDSTGSTNKFNLPATLGADGDVLHKGTSGGQPITYWAALASGGTPSLTSNHVGFGSGANTLTSSPNYIYDTTNSKYEIGLFSNDFGAQMSFFKFNDPLSSDTTQLIWGDVNGVSGQNHYILQDILNGRTNINAPNVYFSGNINAIGTLLSNTLSGADKHLTEATSLGQLQNISTSSNLILRNDSLISTGGGSQSLQQVTDIGDTTNHSLSIISTSGNLSIFNNANNQNASIGIINSFGGGTIALGNNTATAIIKSANITGARSQQLPDGSGVYGLSVNSVPFGTDGNVVVSGGSSCGSLGYTQLSDGVGGFSCTNNNVYDSVGGKYNVALFNQAIAGTLGIINSYFATDLSTLKTVIGDSATLNTYTTYDYLGNTITNFASNVSFSSSISTGAGANIGGGLDVTTFDATSGAKRIAAWTNASGGGTAGTLKTGTGIIIRNDSLIATGGGGGSACYSLPPNEVQIGASGVNSCKDTSTQEFSYQRGNGSTVNTIFGVYDAGFVNSLYFGTSVAGVARVNLGSLNGLDAEDATGITYIGWQGGGYATKVIVDRPDSSITLQGTAGGLGKLFIKADRSNSHSNGDVLSLKDKTTGETEWATPSGGSQPITQIVYGGLGGDTSDANHFITPNGSTDLNADDGMGDVGSFQISPGDMTCSGTDGSNTSTFEISNQGFGLSSGISGFAAGITTNLASGHLQLTNNSIALEWPNSDGSAGQSMITDGSGHLSFGGLVGPYRVSAKLDTLTATRNDIVDWTVGGVSKDSTFEIHITLDVRAISAGTLTMQVVYTDQHGDVQSKLIFPTGLTTTGITTVSEPLYPVVAIRALNNTVIQVNSLFTGISTTYDVSALITNAGY